MNKYRKVLKPRTPPVTDDDEIRVSAAGSVSAYVSRAGKLLNEMEKPYLVITATGNALTKAVTAAEVIKRRFKGLHQLTKLDSQDVEDEYEPLEEGLDKVTEVRSLPVMEIKLSKEALATDDIGYQPPIDESLVKEVDPEELTKGRGRGRGRGKGKGKGKSKGKGSSKSRGSSPRKGKGRGKSKGESKGKSKGKGKRDGSKGRSPSGGGRYPQASKGKSSGKSKGKSSGYSQYPTYGSSGKSGSSKGGGKYGGSYGGSSWGNDWSYGGGGGGYGNSWSYGGGGKGKSSGKGKGKSSWSYGY